MQHDTNVKHEFTPALKNCRIWHLSWFIWSHRQLQQPLAMANTRLVFWLFLQYCSHYFFVIFFFYPNKTHDRYCPFKNMNMYFNNILVITNYRQITKNIFLCKRNSWIATIKKQRCLVDLIQEVSAVFWSVVTWHDMTCSILHYWWDAFF